MIDTLNSSVLSTKTFPKPPACGLFGYTVQGLEEMHVSAHDIDHLTHACRYGCDCEPDDTIWMAQSQQ